MPKRVLKSEISTFCDFEHTQLCGNEKSYLVYHKMLGCYSFYKDTKD